MTPFRLSRRIVFLLVAAIVIAAGSYALALRASRQMQSDTTYVPQQFAMTPEVKLLQRYLRIDTTNPPGREAAGARFIAAQLRSAGVQPELIELAPGRTNVYARIRGTQPGEGLLLMHHIDVVPAPPAGWTHPPFSGDITLDMMYGRGALDMKSIGITQLRAFLDVATSHRTPLHDIALLACADEEEGGAFGVAGLIRNRPDLFDGIHYVFTEGGVTEMLKDQVTYYGVEVGSKQIVTIHATASDRSKLQRLRIALEPEFDPRDPDELLPEVVDYARRVAPHRISGSELMSDLRHTEDEGKMWLLPSAFRVLTQNNVFMNGVTPEDGGFQSTVYLENLPGTDPDATIAKFRSVAEHYGVAFEVTRKNGPSAISRFDTPLIRIGEQEVQRLYGQNVDVGPLVLPYSTTDCRLIRPLGIECYGFPPFPVDFFLTQSVHSVDERIKLGDFNRGVDLMRSIVGRWASSS